MVKIAAQHDMLSLMQAGVHGIIALVGALKMLSLLFFDPKTCKQRWELGRQAARLHIKVFAAHYAWHWIPSVVKCLPDMLLPSKAGANAVCGVSLRLAGSRFQEPLPRGQDARAVEARARTYIQPQKEIWAGCLEALDELARMLRLEIITFKARLWGGHLSSAQNLGMCFCVEFLLRPIVGIRLSGTSLFCGDLV